MPSEHEPQPVIIDGHSLRITEDAERLEKINKRYQKSCPPVIRILETVRKGFGIHPHIEALLFQDGVIHVQTWRIDEEGYAKTSAYEFSSRESAETFFNYLTDGADIQPVVNPEAEQLIGHFNQLDAENRDALIKFAGYLAQK